MEAFSLAIVVVADDGIDSISSGNMFSLKMNRISDVAEAVEALEQTLTGKFFLGKRIRSMKTNPASVLLVFCGFALRKSQWSKSV